MSDDSAHQLLQLTILEIWIVFVAGFVLLYWLSRSYMRRKQWPPPKYRVQLQQRLRQHPGGTTVSERTSKQSSDAAKQFLVNLDSSRIAFLAGCLWRRHRACCAV